VKGKRARLRRRKHRKWLAGFYAPESYNKTPLATEAKKKNMDDCR
jgi:hypothetical protein